MRPYAVDLRQRVVNAYDAGDGSMRALAERYNMSLSFVRDLLKRYRQTGSVTPAPHGGGRARAIAREDEPLLLSLCQQHNDATLEELAALLAGRGITAGKSSVERALKRLRITRKKRPSAPWSGTRSASSGNAASS